MTRFSFLVVFLLTCFSSFSQVSLVDHWETVVYDSSLWRYALGTTDPGASWKAGNFDDQAWLEGRGSIGYGDNDDRTVIGAVPSVFLRKKFSINDKSKIASLVFHMDFDDGFVAYLNGTEIARGNIAIGIPVFNQGTPTDHEALLYQGQVPDRFEVDTQLLLNGENNLSVEVHNVNVTSSDLTAAPFLSVGIIDGSHTYGPTPSWFSTPAPQTFVDSDLPIVVINTHGQLIYDEPRIEVDMGIIDNGPGVRNALTDPLNGFDGRIGIEIRGESSQSFPKKSWRIETHDAAGENLNVSLLGMPPDNDWVLYAPYTDKTLMRDVLTYLLGNEIGNVYAPRTRFVEVVVNGNYEGIYVLMEKIKRDKNRVNVSKLTPTDIAGDAITGGYILRADKIDANDYPAWTPTPNPHLLNEGNPSFQFYDPKGEELVSQQRDYIQTYMYQFESALSGATFGDQDVGYPKYIDVPSFVNFMLISEIGKNIDSYIYSTYLYKERDSKGGKLFMGPLWDFNLAYGNVDYLANSQFAPGWTYNDNYRMFWFRRLMQSPSYRSSMKCRWTELRENKLSNSHILHAIDSMASLLGESQVRNYVRWPILGTYVWPNQYVGATFQDEINFLKTWIATRLAWMDSNLPGDCSTVTGLNGEHKSLTMGEIFPNPTHGAVKIKFENPANAIVQLNVYNEVGELVSAKQFGPQEEPVWDGGRSDGDGAAAGIYVAEIRLSGKVIFRGKVVKIP